MDVAAPVILILTSEAATVVEMVAEAVAAIKTILIRERLSKKRNKQQEVLQNIFAKRNKYFKR